MVPTDLHISIADGGASCCDSNRKMKTLTAVLRHSLIQLVLSAHERTSLNLHPLQYRLCLLHFFFSLFYRCNVYGGEGLLY